MIEFYDVIISMGYIPNIESLREINFFSDLNLSNAFIQAITNHGYTSGQAKKLVLDLCPKRNPAELNFLFYLDNRAIMNYILEIANSN